LSVVLWASYALLILCAGLAGGRPRGPGEAWRAAGVTLGTLFFVAGLSLAAGGEHHTTVSSLLFGSLIGGSAVYTVGALMWHGPSAFWWRVAGWCGLVVALAIPTMLTLALPLVGLLAFTLALPRDPAARTLRPS
jgi:hypothetical protein